MPLTIPITADIRTALFYILRNNADVIAWASENNIDLGGTRFREWEPFAPLLDLSVLIDIDPVVELVPGMSCRNGIYETRFTLYVHYTGPASTLASQWLGVLETALDDSSGNTTGVSGQIILVNDVDFFSRGGQTRREEGFELQSSFRCKARYG